MNKTVLVTGATSGFGKAIAQKFAENGFNLIITGRRKPRLIQLQEELNKRYGIETLALDFDVRSQEQVNQALSDLPTPFQEIDILINNAGLASGLDHIQDGDITD